MNVGAAILLLSIISVLSGVIYVCEHIYQGNTKIINFWRNENKSVNSRVDTDVTVTAFGTGVVRIPIANCAIMQRTLEGTIYSDNGYIDLFVSDTCDDGKLYQTIKPKTNHFFSIDLPKSEVQKTCIILHNKNLMFPTTVTIKGIDKYLCRENYILPSQYDSSNQYSRISDIIRQYVKKIVNDVTDAIVFSVNFIIASCIIIGSYILTTIDFMLWLLWNGVQMLIVALKWAFVGTLLWIFIIKPVLFIADIIARIAFCCRRPSRKYDEFLVIMTREQINKFFK